MKPSTRKFANTFMRSRNSVERKGLRIIQSALVKQYQDFLTIASNLSPGSWRDIQIKEVFIREAFEKLYPMCAGLGLMVRKNMLRQKDAEEDFYLSIFQGKLQNLINTTIYSDRIRSITNTSKANIDKVISTVLDTGEMEGWGVDKMAQELRRQIGNQITGNVRARAKGIAQTETISASNQASAFAADSTGLEYRKFWLSSHLQNVRPTHSEAEEDSIRRGGLRQEERHSNGLLYPGDPSGSAEEVINCRCTELYEIV